jgi:hypothetical protein
MLASRPAECKVSPKLLAVCMAEVLLTHMNRIKTTQNDTHVSGLAKHLQEGV